MTVLRIAACLAIGGAILAQPLQSVAGRALRIPFVPDSRILRKVSPVYPHAAIQRRIQGTVCFAALIGQDGRVEHLRLLSGHPLLIVAAREAAQQWAYVPATVRGIPVRVITQIQIHFALDQYVKPGKVARATPRGVRDIEVEPLPAPWGRLAAQCHILFNLCDFCALSLGWIPLP